MTPKIKFLAHRIASLWGLEIEEISPSRIIFKNSFQTYEIHRFKDLWLCVRYDTDALGWEYKENGQYIFAYTLKSLLKQGLKTYASPYEAWRAMGLVN